MQMQVTARHRLQQRQPCRQRTRGLPAAIRAGQSTEQQVKTGRQDAAPIDSFGFRPSFHDDFELGRMLGSGSFGVVHVAQHRISGRLYAVKSIPKRFFGQHLEPQFVARIQHEVDVARHMGQSLNVIHLIESYEDDVCVDLVMELAAGGNLWSRIKQGNQGSSEKLAARLISDMLRAVAQCHAKGVIVRDVKPENFLFLSDRPDSPLKMVDFGLADYCRPGETLSERAGTPCYVAPEVLKQAYSLPADIWSTGVAAYQLLTGQLPWHTDPDWLESQAPDGSASSSSGVNTSNKQLWRAILYGELDFEWPPWDTLSAGARDFVQSMLQRDPALRPTASELLQHPWLTGTSGTSSISMASVDTAAAAAKEERPLDDSLVQRLQRYGTWGRLKQLALRQVAKVMSADAAGLQGLAEAFAALDMAGSGRIPYSQLVELLRSEQYDLSDVEVRMLVCQFDLDTDGNVDYYEFVAALLDWPKAQSHSNWESWLQQVFEQFDVDKSGSISSSELGDLLGLAPACELEGQEPYVIEDAVPAALRHSDVDGDGKISFEEFAALLQTDVGDRLDLFASRRRRGQQISAAAKQHFNASSTGAGS